MSAVIAGLIDLLVLSLSGGNLLRELKETGGWGKINGSGTLSENCTSPAYKVDNRNFQN